MSRIAALVVAAATLALTSPAAAFSIDRRAALQTAASAAIPFLSPVLPPPAYAADESAGGGGVSINGVVSLKDASLLSDIANPSAAAIYVTARPARPDNVPAAILSGTRGKPPPVLAARFGDVSFPYSFRLTGENLTVEGASAVAGEMNGQGKEPWWSNDDLIVSVRYDTDGVAATRDATDLVGRGLFVQKDKGELVRIQLEGRGVFGKSITAR